MSSRGAFRVRIKRGGGRRTLGRRQGFLPNLTPLMLLREATVHVVLRGFRQGVLPSGPVILPEVPWYLTGGTVQGAASDCGELAYRAGDLHADALVEAMVRTEPRLAEVVRLVSRQPFQIAGQDLTGDHLLALIPQLEAERAAGRAPVASVGTDGIVALSYFAHLTARREGPPLVVFGAMRIPQDENPDGPANLLDASVVATDPRSRNRGVLVVENGLIHAPDFTRKTHTFEPGAFASVNGPPVGELFTFRGRRRLRYFQPPPEVIRAPPFSLEGITALPRVDLIAAQHEMDPAQFEFLRSRGAQGLVLLGMGNGVLPADAEAAMAKVASQMPVVRASQVPEGQVEMNKEIPDGLHGTLPSLFLSGEMARILLQLMLATHPFGDRRTQERRNFSSVFLGLAMGQMLFEPSQPAARRRRAS